MTVQPALAAFREARQQADAEGATGDRVRRGMVAAIEAVSLVMWTGKPGPAQRLEVTIIADGEGNAWIEPTGEWQDTTVIDDGRPDARP